MQKYILNKERTKEIEKRKEIIRQIFQRVILYKYIKMKDYAK